MRVRALTGAGLALVGVCYGLARFAYGLFVPVFRDAFGLDGTLLGAVAAGSYVGYCVAILAAAGAVARWGPRAVAVAAGVIAVVGLVMVAVAPNGAVLAAGVLIAGASTGVASPPMAEAISVWTPARGRDRRQAIVNAGPGVGIAVSGPVALFASEQWRLAWGCFAVIAVAVTAWVAWALPSGAAVGGPGDPGAVSGAISGERSRNPSLAVWAIARDRRSLRLIAAAALFGAASTAVWTFGRDHVVQASGLGPATSILLWVVLGVAELAGLAAGDLAARIGLRRLWTGALLLVAASTSALGFFPGVRVAAFVAVAIFGAAYVILTTVVFFWATRLHPDRISPAVAVGFLTISAGQAIASPAAGAIADQTGTTGAFLTCAVLAALTAAVTPPTALNKTAANTRDVSQHRPPQLVDVHGTQAAVRHTGEPQVEPFQ